MAYCTYEDVEMRLGAADLARLADLDDDGAADTDVVARAIADAQSLMDSSLACRFRVPVALADGSTPAALRTRAVNLAVYFLHLGRDSVTDDVRAQHDDDLRWLERVAAGRVSLGTDEPVAESSGAVGVRVQSQPRIFGRGEPL